MNHSSAWGYSPRLPVSVYGTGCFTRCFLEVASMDYQFGPEPSLYYPTLSCGSTYYSVSTHHLHASVTFIVSRYGNINPFAIGFALRLHLRSRLTLFWLASNEEPLVLRRQGFSPCLSLLMPTFAFVASPPCLTAQLLPNYNAPLPILTDSIASVVYLMPEYFPRKNARLVSCYALFKWMAASKPTS